MMNEVKDDDFEQMQKELKRCLARLSYVGMGVSSELDVTLGELRQQIKQDAGLETIKQQVELISRQLRAIEDNQTATNSLSHRQKSETLDLSEDPRMPALIKSQLQSEMLGDAKQSLVSVSSVALELILDYLERLRQKTEVESKSGLMSSLFGRKDKKTAEEDDEQNSWSVTEELRGSLQQLVDQLSAMENYRTIAESLTDKVVSLDNVDQLVEILEQLTTAFIDVSGQEHAQLESFLLSLNQRIDRVNQFVDQSQDYSDQVSADSEQLDREVKQQFASLQSSVADASSLEQVKHDLGKKMDVILSKIDHFTSAQTERVSGFQQGIEVLKDQLRATFDESSRLKEELAAQRVRAQTDHLTQLPNRYAYNERLTQEYNRWRRYRSPLSLVICDIDHFKNVNDQFGHVAGDEVLKKVAGYVQASVRESDFIARFGGEEFIILLPETLLPDATKAMNKLRLGIRELNVEHEGEKIQTTMSFGISEFENDDTPKAVFSRADRALYRAKEKGRDQVCCQRARSAKDS